MVRRLEGKPVAQAIDGRIAEGVSRLGEAGITPTLAVVRVGARPDDLSYERSVKKRAERLGVDVRTFEVDPAGPSSALDEVLTAADEDDGIHGILLFRPLPKGFDEEAACNRISPEKDVDGVSALSLSHVFTGLGVGFAPSTAQACMEMLDFYGIPVQGAHAVVLGRSLVIGRPAAALLLQAHATVTTVHSRTRDAAALTRQADIVVCATGRPRAYGTDFFSAGQTVLDVGINFDEAGALCGDVDYDGAAEALGDEGALTPVPGGIGSVTAAVTLLHTVEAALAAAAIQVPSATDADPASAVEAATSTPPIATAQSPMTAAEV